MFVVLGFGGKACRDELFQSETLEILGKELGEIAPFGIVAREQNRLSPKYIGIVVEIRIYLILDVCILRVELVVLRILCFGKVFVRHLLAPRSICRRTVPMHKKRAHFLFAHSPEALPQAQHEYMKRKCAHKDAPSLTCRSCFEIVVVFLENDLLALMLNSIFSAHLDFSPPAPKSCSHPQNAVNYTINTFTSFPSALPDTISDNAQVLPC